MQKSRAPRLKFATRQNLGLNRPPAIWFIRRFLDAEAEILLFPAETVIEDARRVGAVPFHTPGVPLHVDKEQRRTTLDAFLAAYEWNKRDPALDMFAEVVNDASFRLPTNEARHPEAHGFKALHLGLRETLPSDDARMAQMMVVCDALYAWCRTRLAEGRAAR